MNTRPTYPLGAGMVTAVVLGTTAAALSGTMPGHPDAVLAALVGALVGFALVTGAASDIHEAAGSESGRALSLLGRSRAPDREGVLRDQLVEEVDCNRALIADVQRGLALMQRRGGREWGSYYWDTHFEVKKLEGRLRESDSRVRKLRALLQEAGAQR